MACAVGLDGGGSSFEGPRGMDWLGRRTTPAAAEPRGQQRTVSDFARRTLSEPGESGNGDVLEATEHGLASALRPSDRRGGELR